MASSQRAAQHVFKTHTLCMFLLFTLGEGDAECEVVTEPLVIIFYLHSLWLSLSRSLTPGIFSSPFCPQGTTI